MLGPVVRRWEDKICESAGPTRWTVDARVGLEHLGREGDLADLIGYSKDALQQGERWFARAEPNLDLPPITHTRTVVIVPGLGTTIETYRPLFRIFELLGLGVVFVPLPGHHEGAQDPHEGLISADLGQTLVAFRQAVCNVRAAIDHVADNGSDPLMLGISVGSCIGALAALYQPNLQRACYTFATADVAHVVWYGVATIGLRERLEPFIDFEGLQAAWIPLSPIAHLPHPYEVESLIISGSYDRVCLPQFTDSLLEDLEKHDIHVPNVNLPCGHYTLGRLPFSAVWLSRVLSFFLRR